MEKYLKEIISQKGLNEAYKEFIHMIESIMNTCSCYKSDTEKLNNIKSLIGIIEEAEIESIYKP